MHSVATTSCVCLLYCCVSSTCVLCCVCAVCALSFRYCQQSVGIASFQGLFAALAARMLNRVCALHTNSLAQPRALCFGTDLCWCCSFMPFTEWLRATRLLTLMCQLDVAPVTVCFCCQHTAAAVWRRQSTCINSISFASALASAACCVLTCV